MARTKLIAANWKMNPTPPTALAEASRGEPYASSHDIDIVAFPCFLDLHQCIAHGLVVGAQCGRPEPSGAFTGDVSMQMLKEAGCSYVLCGHSERRKYHGETDAFIAEQVAAAMKVGLTPILCIGETDEERTRGEEFSVIKRQLTTVLSKLETQATQLVIAYEPIWAIGSGKTATPAEAQEMHAFIRSLLPENIRDTVRILYGGSVKSANAQEILRQPDIDGALVGGASLDPEEFRKIVGACH